MSYKKKCNPKHLLRVYNKLNHVFVFRRLNRDFIYMYCIKKNKKKNNYQL